MWPHEAAVSCESTRIHSAAARRQGMFLGAQSYTDIRTYIHAYTYIHANIHAYIHTYIHTYMHTYVLMHTYILIHTYIMYIRTSCFCVDLHEI